MTIDPEPEVDDSAEQLIGEVIDGKYRVDALLGEGGMGAVFKVHHTGLRRDLALKVLRPELTSHKEVAARFDREAQSCARLDHPNCLQVTDFGTTREGLKYMVMQLLSGHELTDELEDCVLPPPRAVDMMLQIVRGLEHAHEHGIVHRDLKPENVFVTTDHEGRELLKLVDFGIAKVLEGEFDNASPKLTQAGMVFGTPRYMSPEQAAGGNIDHRSDLYSAGIIFYQMLAGTVPFDADDLVKVLRQQIIDPPPPLPESVPADLRAIVERLLAKDRDERFADAAELIDALEQHRTAAEGGPATDQPAAANGSGGTMPPMPGANHSVPPIMPIGTGPVMGPDATMAPSAGVTTPRSRTSPALQTMVPFSAASPWERLTRGRPPYQVVAAAVGGLLAFVLTCSWMFGDDEPTSPDAPEEEAWYEGLLAGGDDGLPDIDSEALEAIDDAIVADRRDQAETALAELEAEHPDHPHLMWRRARLLAKDDGTRRQALALYGDAAAKAPALLDEPKFFAELARLLREPKLHGKAVTVAIDQLGHAGHAFLLERLNDLEAPLPWAERKRAVEAVSGHEECAALLDARKQIAQDLLQASETDGTCALIASSLMTMKLDPHAVYLQPAHDFKLPRECREHKELLAEVRAALVEKHGPPKGSKGGGRCRGLKGMFRSGC